MLDVLRLSMHQICTVVMHCCFPRLFCPQMSHESYVAATPYPIPAKSGRVLQALWDGSVSTVIDLPAAGSVGTIFIVDGYSERGLCNLS
jgi:hypothetical protein